ncbi:MAG: M48 family metallopeptidase [Opitutaceae bacterium]|nr:M48 family metallopeptidase [Opitutaceae bacterium]
MKSIPFLFLALTLALAGCHTNPVTGRKSLALLSTAEEMKLGAASFQEIRQKEKVSADTRSNARVTRIGQRIAAAVGDHLPDAKWEFVVFDSDQLNAFALPGGKVGVYTGLLKLAENDSELAIVMGHEIGHVTARHGNERMSEAMVIQGVTALATTAADASTSDPQKKQLYGLAFGGASALVTVGRVLPHSRANESEADKMGAIYAARAGYDPRAAVTFWQKMMAQKKASDGKGGTTLSALLSTHPSDEKRIADLRALMPEVMPIYEKNKGKFQD